MFAGTVLVVILVLSVSHCRYPNFSPDIAAIRREEQLKEERWRCMGTGPGTDPGAMARRRCVMQCANLIHDCSRTVEIYLLRMLKANKPEPWTP